MAGDASARATPLLVTEHFLGDSIEYALLEAAIGIDMVIGGLILGAWGGFKGKVVTGLSGAILMGVGTGLVGLAPGNLFPMALGGDGSGWPNESHSEWFDLRVTTINSTTNETGKSIHNYDEWYLGNGVNRPRDSWTPRRSPRNPGLVYLRRCIHHIDGSWGPSSSHPL